MKHLRYMRHGGHICILACSSQSGKRSLFPVVKISHPLKYLIQIFVRDKQILKKKRKKKKRSLCAAETFSDPLFCETDIFHTPSLISGKFSEKFHTPYIRNSVVRDFPPKISYPLQNSHKISYPFNFPGKFSDP